MSDGKTILAAARCVGRLAKAASGAEAQKRRKLSRDLRDLARIIRKPAEEETSA